MKQKGICEECKKEYEYEYNPKYPRKYCPECSAAKKAAYENKDSGEGMPANDPRVAQNQSMGQIATTEGISKVEHDFQSSYELGPAGNRHTIKYREVNELKDKIRMLTAEGLITE